MWFYLLNSHKNVTTVSRDVIKSPEAIQVFAESFDAEQRPTEEQLKGIAEPIYELFGPDLTFEQFSVAFITVVSLVNLIYLSPDDLKNVFADDAARLNYVFACVDADSSGYLQKDKLVALAKILRNLGGVLPDDTKPFYRRPLKRLFAPLNATDLAEGWLRETDTNRDGKISREEFSGLGPKLQFRQVLQVEPKPPS